MPCRSCTQARAATIASAKAFITGNIHEGATRAKEAGTHIADKVLAESERVRAMMTRKP